jgi:hypothetical protein
MQDSQHHGMTEGRLSVRLRCCVASSISEQAQGDSSIQRTVGMSAMRPVSCGHINRRSPPVLRKCCDRLAQELQLLRRHLHARQPPFAPPVERLRRSTHPRKVAIDVPKVARRWAPRAGVVGPGGGSNTVTGVKQTTAARVACWPTCATRLRGLRRQASPGRAES